MLRRLSRIAAHMIAVLALIWSGSAMAQVQIHFHSFDGSVLFGSRYPHTFIVLEGTLEDGTPINENYGSSARRVTPAILSGPVEHMVLAESEKNVRSTNRHFSLDITDEEYRKVVALV